MVDLVLRTTNHVFGRSTSKFASASAAQVRKAAMLISNASNGVSVPVACVRMPDVEKQAGQMACSPVFRKQFRVLYVDDLALNIADNI
jgi:hypothetical protein